MSTIKQIDSIFNRYIEEENFSGVGFIKQGESVIYNKAFGYAHRGFKIPNYTNTKFDTASITKMFTTVAILQLVDKGLIALTDKVLDIIDIGESKLSKDITIYHLLTHTSGIGDDADEEAGESYEEIWRTKPNYSVKETRDYLAQFKDKEPYFKPGEGCRYNNCAFILLGLIIEEVTGKTYREYVKEHIFDAIEMKDTGFYAMNDVVENAAEHYASILDSEENVIGYNKNIYSYPSIGSADAGALTTATDLELFLTSLRKGELLSEGLTEDILKPKELHKEYGKVTTYMGFGLSFIVSNETKEVVYFQKDGVNAGVACVMNYYPQHDITTIVMSNQDANVWDLAWEITEVITGKLL